MLHPPSPYITAFMAIGLISPWTQVAVHDSAQDGAQRGADCPGARNTPECGTDVEGLDLISTAESYSYDWHAGYLTCIFTAAHVALEEFGAGGWRVLSRLTRAEKVVTRCVVPDVLGVAIRKVDEATVLSHYSIHS